MNPIGKVMDFLTKIENLINHLIIKLQELTVSFIKKRTPAKVKVILMKLQNAWLFCVINFKRLPQITKTWLIAFIAKTKANLLSYNYKAKLKETYDAAMAQYKLRQPKNAGKFKAILYAPFMMMAQWLKGLSTAQSVLLLGFTAASFLAVCNIVFSGNRLLNQHLNEGRAPASIEDEIAYPRPVYYKKPTKHLEITSIRLPVYIPEVNELRSIDIDFVATLSNRSTRKWLEKKEFQLRDYLILHVEPLSASFPLEEEGKEIIRKKLLAEIDDFLILHQQDGHVTELKLTYILAN